MDWYRAIPKDRNGCKYELTKPVSVKVDTDLPPCSGRMKTGGNVCVMAKGHYITVLPPYRWDGATCAPDFDNVILPALIHDVLYDAIKSGYKLPFETADAIFMSLMKATDFKLKNTYYSAVRRFGEWCRRDLSTGNLIIENHE